MTQSKSLAVDCRDLKAKGNLPRHIAVIMDGNGRWATKRGLPRIAGHHAGRRSVRDIVEACHELGIECLTLFTFSSENWTRPKAEVKGLMSFLRQVLVDEVETLRKNNVRMFTIGRTKELPDAVQNELQRTMDTLKDNTGLRLVLALSYGGRRELVDCFQRIHEEIEAGRLDPSEVDEKVIDRFLYTSDWPDPDLLIRTSGEMRLSNFLLWQLAYAEIYVTDVLWPDFRRQDLYRAIAEYQKRDRRFGGVR